MRSGEAARWQARLATAATGLATMLAGPAGAAPAQQAVPAQSADAPGAPSGDLVVHFAGLRSTKGMIRVCLTRDPAFLAHCERDPAARKASVAAGKDAQVHFAGLPAGDYALAVLHDENGNGRLDKMFGIPKEGVGFSRDPKLHFGPPKWDEARFHVASGATEQRVTFKYFL